MPKLPLDSHVRDIETLYPGMTLIRLKDGKVIMIDADVEGYFRVGIYFNEEQAIEGSGVIVTTDEVVDAAR